MTNEIHYHVLNIKTAHVQNGYVDHFTSFFSIAFPRA